MSNDTIFSNLAMNTLESELDECSSTLEFFLIKYMHILFQLAHNILVL